MKTSKPTFPENICNEIYCIPEELLPLVVDCFKGDADGPEGSADVDHVGGVVEAGEVVVHVGIVEAGQVELMTEQVVTYLGDRRLIKD